MDRRRFIKWGSFMTVSVASSVVLAACGGGDDGDDGAAPPTTAPPVPPAQGSTPTPAALSFSQGVASGDPRPDSVVLWTRVDGGDGVAPVSVRVQVASDSSFQSLVVDTMVSAAPEWDYTLRHKVTGMVANTVYYYRFITGAVTSMAGRTWTAPAATDSVAKLKFAFISSQDWETNHWAAFDAMQSEDIDFVVHLGDYIYEQVNRPALVTPSRDPQHGPITLPDGTKLDDGSVYATTLNDYRALYKAYRSDPRLQRVHANWPMIAIWNDHEFSNDCWQDHQTYTTQDLPPQTARRRSANQAWFEFMAADVPLSAADQTINDIQIYRSFQFGDLATLVMTDQRLYRADHMISEQSVGSAIGSRYFVSKAAVAGAEQLKMQGNGNALTPVSMLGDTQRQWWQDQMSGANTTWKLWGNDVPLMRMQVDVFALVVDALTLAVISTNAALPPLKSTFRTILQQDLNTALSQNLQPAPFAALNTFGSGLGFPEDDTLAVIEGLNAMLPPYAMLTTLLINADQWDGYAAERSNLMQFLGSQNIGNVVALTGDARAFFAGTVLDDFDTTKKAVMVDLVTAGISSSSLATTYIELLNDGGNNTTWLNQLAVSSDLTKLDTLLKPNNAWLSYTDTDAQGYAVVTLTPGELTCTFKKVTPMTNGQVPTAAQAIASSQVVTVAAGTAAVTVASV
jgi:alkaline phosphatase D